MEHFKIKIKEGNITWTQGLPIDEFVTILNYVNSLDISEEEKNKAIFNNSVIIIEKSETDNIFTESTSDKYHSSEDFTYHLIGKGEAIFIATSKDSLAIGVKQDLSTVIQNKCKNIEEIQTKLIPEAGKFEENTIEYEAKYWLENGEQGLSSLSLCYNLCGDKIKEEMKKNGMSSYIDYPRDSGDFGRCYKFFNMVPKAKENLSNMKAVSNEWFKLVNVWDKLTENYEKLLSAKKNEDKDIYSGEIYKIITTETSSTKPKPR